MAYGKIKADTITYDNSGSDVDTTIASLVAPKEGTAIKSTGESGTTKFLRVDGDGTCSWQVPPDTNTQLTLIDEDDMASNDATKPPSQQSVKVYVDLKAPLANPTFTGTVNAAALTLSGDLTVNGTTTTIDTATLNVEDKNIELGKVSSPSDTTADGGGITLKGATDKTITWVNSTDAWTFNQNVNLSLSGDGGITATASGNHAVKIIGDANRSADGNTLLSLHGKWNGTQVAIIDMQAGDDTTNKDNGQIVFYTAEAGSAAVALTIAENKSATFTGPVTGTTISDSKGNVRSIPQNTQGSTYTLVAADAGKHILASGTVNLPPNVFAAGDAVTIINNTSGDIALAVAGGSVYNAADAGTGNWTLSARGVATAIWISATVAHISGSGLS